MNTPTMIAAIIFFFIGLFAKSLMTSKYSDIIYIVTAIMTYMLGIIVQKNL